MEFRMKRPFTFIEKALVIVLELLISSLILFHYFSFESMKSSLAINVLIQVAVFLILAPIVFSLMPFLRKIVSS